MQAFDLPLLRAIVQVEVEVARVIQHVAVHGAVLGVLELEQPSVLLLILGKHTVTAGGLWDTHRHCHGLMGQAQAVEPAYGACSILLAVVF